MLLFRLITAKLTICLLSVRAHELRLDSFRKTSHLVTSSVAADCVCESICIICRLGFHEVVQIRATTLNLFGSDELHSNLSFLFLNALSRDDSLARLIAVNTLIDVFKIKIFRSLLLLLQTFDNGIERSINQDLLR